MNNRDQNEYMDNDGGRNSGGRNTMLVTAGNADFKLVRINDGFAGESFPLVEHINTIGRIDENTILLSHKSISRNHAQIIRDGSIHRLVDLDSSNGTFCNGRQVRRSYPVDLTDGAILQFGSIEFVFVPINKEIDPKSYAQTSTKWLIIAGMGILFLLIVAGASIGFTLYQNGRMEHSATTHEESLDSKVQRLITIGRQQLETGDWKAASKTFEMISSILPNQPEADQLRQRAQLELEAEQQYEKAGEAIESGDFAKAREILNDIPKDTEAKRRALNQLPRVEEKLAAKYVTEASSLMGQDTPQDLVKAYNLLVDAAKLEPPPQTRVKKAIHDLRKLYKNKRLKFTPIKLGNNDDTDQ